MSRALAKAKKYEDLFRDYALALPETREDFPWGERVIKVKDKVFIFMGRGGDEVGLSVKLPNTGGVALTLPFCEPTGYGLGKHGWVSASFKPGEDPPVPMILAWIDESYRACAPKMLLKKLAGGVGMADVPTKKKKKVAKAKATTAKTKKKTAKR